MPWCMSDDNAQGCTVVHPVLHFKGPMHAQDVGMRWPAWFVSV